MHRLSRSQRVAAPAKATAEVKDLARMANVAFSKGAKDLDELRRCPLLLGRLVEGVVITGLSVAKVAHKLGRKPVGWIVVGKNGNANIWQSGTASATELPLDASSAVTCAVWVF